MGAWFLLFFLSVYGLCGNANALSLHIGDTRVPLTNVRNTSPSLAVAIEGGTYWGALFPDNAPTGTLRLNINGMQYWLGEYCVPGTYLAPGSAECTDCGLGHYCTGGRHRAACTGGAIGCPGTRASADISAPEFANRVLTADEITENIPSTDLSQWRQVSCCSDNIHNDTLYKDLSLVNSVHGCADGVLPTGTYMFTMRTSTFCTSYDIADPFNGAKTGYTANMMIFDHPVSYKTIHAANIFYHFVDIDGPDFTEWDLRVPTAFYCSVDIRANVSGLGTVPRFVMCVYELK